MKREDDVLIQLLGPIGAVDDDGELVAAPGMVAAGVLARLTLAEGRLVTADALAEAVWESPPPSARNALQVAVSKLRRLLGAELIDSSHGGYRLRSGTVRVDRHEAREYAARASAAADAHRPREALTLARSGLELFVGPPYAGWLSPMADAERARAERLHRALRLTEAEGLTLLGEPSIAEEILRDLAADDPFGEAVHTAWMRALSAAGRNAEALEVYERLRTRLADELGTDPSAPAQELFLRLLGGATIAARPRPGPATPTLPVFAHDLLGREEEVADVVALVSGSHRLLTVLGTGGVGKTRLAVECARRLARELGAAAVFADLTQADENHGALALVEATLGVEREQWSEVLAGSPAVVVLDNAEHLLAEVREVANALLGVEGVSVLVTSRSPLKLREETVYELQGLEARSATDAAIVLLADRAGIRRDRIADHADALCTLVAAAEGLPLVLELLASEMRWTAPTELAERIEELMPTLAADDLDRPARHLSLRAATEWSLRQASDGARSALAALTVVRAPFDLGAARAVTRSSTPSRTRELLGELLDLSLIQRVSEPGAVRFRILEPIRQSAVASELVPGVDDAVRDAHADHFLGAVEDAHARCVETDRELVALMRATESDVRSALEWRWHRDRSAALDQLGAVLTGWFLIDRDADLLAWSERALADPAAAGAARARVALIRLSLLLWVRNADTTEDEALLQLVDEHGPELTGEWSRRWVYVHATLASIAGDLDEALRWLERHPRETPFQRISRDVLHVQVLTRSDQREELPAVLDAALGSPELAAHPVWHAVLLNWCGRDALTHGDHARARMLLDRALALDPGVSTAAVVAKNAAWVRWAESEPRGALDTVVDILGDHERRVDQVVVLESALIAGLALADLGATNAAATLAQACSAAAADHPGVLEPWPQKQLEQLVARVGPGGSSPRPEGRSLAELVLDLGVSAE